MPQSRILKAGDQVPITPIDQPPFVDSRPDSPASVIRDRWKQSGFSYICAPVKRTAMSKVCQITGKHVITGNKVSHSNRKTRRTFEPNLQDRKYFLAGENKWVSLRVSAAGMRTINKIGIETAMKQAKEKGFL
jgi:large subunit ribosomal protein L28